MLYTDFFKKASEAVILVDENSGVVFLDPHYRVTLQDWDLDPAQIEDYPTNWSQLGETLKLEVKRLNDCSSKIGFVTEWLYRVITSTVEPMMLQEENEYIRNVMEYMRLNNALKEKEKDLTEREAKADSRDNIRQMMPGMSFAKKGTK